MMLMTAPNTEPEINLEGLSAADRLALEEALCKARDRIQLQASKNPNDARVRKARRSMIYQVMVALAVKKDSVEFDVVRERFLRSQYPGVSLQEAPAQTIDELTAAMEYAWTVVSRFLRFRRFCMELQG